MILLVIFVTEAKVAVTVYASYGAITTVEQRPRVVIRYAEYPGSGTNNVSSVCAPYGSPLLISQHRYCSYGLVCYRWRVSSNNHHNPWLSNCDHSRHCDYRLWPWDQLNLIDAHSVSTVLLVPIHVMHLSAVCFTSQSV